ncbi:MAG: MMPL family transporter [Desulfobacterales bacterium]|nr:MMPL family transporter [Desulfobacterales bacterium]
MININRINEIFGSAGERIVRFRYLIVICFVLILAFGFAGLGKVKTDAGWDKWLLDDSELKLAEDEFKDIFGNNDYVGVLVTADTLLDPAILKLIRELSRELEAKVPFANDVLSITDCEFSLGNDAGIEIINPVPDPIPTDSATLANIREQLLSKDLLRGKLISRDATQSWIMLRLSPFPEGWRDENNKAADMVVGKVATDIIRQDKYAPLTPKSAGMPVIAHDKTAFFKAEVMRTMGLSLLVSLVVLTLALRSVRGILMTILVAAGSVILTFGLQGWMDRAIDVAMVMVPLYLGVAVSIGYSIHIFTFFNREFAATGKRKNAVRHAVKETGWPILFTALTTIGALYSFHFVDVTPVRWVGSATSLLVFIVFLMVMIMIPALLSFGKDRTMKKNKKGNLRPNARLENLMTNLSRFVLTYPKSILAVFTLFVMVCGSGLMFFQVNFDMRKNMGLKIPYVKRLDEVCQSELGSLYSYNLVVEFPGENLAMEPENLKKLDVLEEMAKGFELTKKTTSITEIIKDMNQVLNQGDPDYYTIPGNRQMIAQIMLLYENAGGREAEKWIDYEYKRFRLMVDLNDYNNQKAKKELALLSQKAATLFPDARIFLAGSIAQFTVMQDIVAKGQLVSFLIAMGVITLLMVIVFGSLKVGLIAMVPNITPAIAVGGIMGWAGIPLEMMTITIMPMLLGLAVDDTIHLITHAKLAFEKTGDYNRSLTHTFTAIGIPLLFTSVILTANFSVYLSSPARVYMFLGFLTGTGIMTALLTDYLVTPVLLRALKAFGPEGEKVSRPTPLRQLKEEAV